MQHYLDAKHPSLCVDSDEGNSNDSSSTDGYLAEKTNWNYNRAEEEFNTFKSFKCNKYRPKWVRAKSEILSGIGLNGDMEEIIVGPVEENGKDLPSGKKMGNYVNEKGRMHMLKFFEEHKHYFPTLWIIVQREAARRVAEVRCEWFFGLSGYISSPRRLRLGVRTYERVAMLASIIQSVCIDNKWVAQQYIERCKKGKLEEGEHRGDVKVLESRARYWCRAAGKGCSIWVDLGGYFEWRGRQGEWQCKRWRGDYSY
jgi:hypothetical protein